jgi:sterol 3beta-glucosyltransferase
MITILCSGSLGDIQPYIALAVELKKQGQDVKIAAGQSFGDFIKSYGVEHYPLTADYKSVDIDPKLLEAAGSSTHPLKMLFTFNKMKKYSRMMVDELYEACVGSDVIVYHPGCTIGYFAAEQMGIPSVLASPFPMLKTAEVASVIAYGKTKMSVSLSYKMLQGMLWMASKTGVMLYWKERFGKLPDNFACPFERVDEKHPSITSCSNNVFPRPKDWNKHAYQFGYWFTSEKEDFTTPKELLDFLAKGEKPIYFGFGSVFNAKDKDVLISCVKESLIKTGKRGILCGMGKVDSLTENIFAIDSVPHTWLFQKCLAVCHHGGAGTTAAGFAAGVPSIIIPFSNDQFAWAHRSYDLRVGAKPIYKKQLSAENLSQAIEYALSDSIVQNAKDLGANIAKENGAKDCADVIIGLVK